MSKTISLVDNEDFTIHGNTVIVKKFTSDTLERVVPPKDAETRSYLKLGGVFIDWMLGAFDEKKGELAALLSSQDMVITIDSTDGKSISICAYKNYNTENVKLMKEIVII